MIVALMSPWLCSGCGNSPPPTASAPPAPTVVQFAGAPGVAPQNAPGASPSTSIVEVDSLDDDGEPTDAPLAPVAEPEPVFRPDDARPRHDDVRAEESGIARYESTHLLLYTDIDPQVARTLPPLMDQAYDALEAYFGPLPPDRRGAEYQMTGYIMADVERFRAAGMLPQAALDLLVHGIHRGSEFWMNNQEYDYYLRHLMIHEGTHCFMTVLNGPRPPAWYMEGMAEYIGTHRIDADGHAVFGVMPDEPVHFVGFGRVEMLREEVAAGRLRGAAGVLALVGNDFMKSRREPYAWSWAFCKFLDAHPRYQARFRALRGQLLDPGFSHRVEEQFAPDFDVLAAEWELFVRNLEYGFDIARAAVDFRRGAPLPAGGAATAPVHANAGWQSTGVLLDAGVTYALTAAGEISLAREPRPWISQPQGVSIRYADGLPLGRVVAAIQSESPPGPNGAGALWYTIDVGRATELTPADSGTLYLRVNDAWSELADNEGAYTIEVARQ
jgi:hypothetical protein